MIQLLVIADDFTGALDTGIQFRGEGTVLRFGCQENYFDGLDESTDVLIIDAETRHLPPAQAADVVGGIVAEAARRGVGCIYKKTDSGLRGNIGSELTAALENAGGKALHFVPAFPRLERITRDGIHYIKGQPVAESVFGKDPFEPVRYSDVRQIIASQTQVPATVVKAPAQDAEGILVYDAATQADVEAIAKALKEMDSLHLLAGCAGFASALAEPLGLKKKPMPVPELAPRLLTICGSVNAITLEQMDTAEVSGVPRIRLSVPQKLNDGWIGTPDFEEALNAWLSRINGSGSTIIECDGLGNLEELEQCRKKLGMDQEAMRRQISRTMGTILKGLLDKGAQATMLVTGGDTLMAFMELAGVNEMLPICEFTPGVVLAQIRYRGNVYHILSKSGGFGDRELLLELEKQITGTVPDGYKEENYA